MIDFQFDDGDIPQLNFESAKAKATTALWSKGRSVILIVNGREHAFPFSDTFTEAKAFVALQESGLPIIGEQEPLCVMLLIQTVCVVALTLTFIFG